MDNIYIGKITSCHGIKGELKIISDFLYKDKVFVVGNQLIIDNNIYTINSYRRHKQYDMVTLNDYHDINEVLFLLKKDVYFRKSDLKLEEDEVLDDELLNYHVFSNKGEGEVREIFMASKDNKIIRVFIDKEYLVPFNSPIIKIDKKNKCIEIEIIDGM